MILAFQDQLLVFMGAKQFIVPVLIIGIKPFIYIRKIYKSKNISVVFGNF